MNFSGSFLCRTFVNFYAYISSQLFSKLHPQLFFKAPTLPNPYQPPPTHTTPHPTHATQAPSHLGRQQRLLATRGRRPRLLATWGKAAKAASRSRKAVQANPTLGTASARATRTREVPESAMRVEIGGNRRNNPVNCTQRNTEHLRKK